MDVNKKLEILRIAYEANAMIHINGEMIILFVNKWEDAKRASENHNVKIGLFEKLDNYDYELVTDIQEPIFGDSGYFLSGNLSYRIGLYFE